MEPALALTVLFLLLPLQKKKNKNDNYPKKRLHDIFQIGLGDYTSVPAAESIMNFDDDGAHGPGRVSKLL